MMRSRNARPGFTLVELMIAAAITVMIMTILSICFQTSMKAMSAMRAQGDAADQLRAVGEVIKRDVNANHFLPVDPGTGPRNLGRRLSDYQNASPRSGFFFVSSPDSLSEGNDGVFTSTRNVQCSLWMTSVLAGGSEGNLYTATVAGTTVSSEAAEIAYFLSAMPGEFTAPGLNGTQNQRFNLHRRQRLVAADQNKQAQFDALLANVATRPQAQTYLSTFQANPTQSHQMTTFNAATRPTFPTPIGTGDDIILSNVLSFEIKPTWVWTGAGPIRSPRAFGTNTDAPFDNLQTPLGGTTTFDTLGGSTMQMRINAMQLRIRIYDPKAKTARQSTFVFEL